MTCAHTLQCCTNQCALINTQYDIFVGNRIEPVGADYILQKLGFQHARLTVPKWMQRGCMDPLDKLFSVLLDRLIVFLKDNSDEDDADASAQPVSKPSLLTVPGLPTLG